MRILAIRGKNLASLAGEFELELDRGSLHAAGVFAITGPVGAGKSTLLDALCLALYNRTPRLSSAGGVLIGRAEEDQKLRLRSNDVRSVLRRGTASGYAEVDFQGSDDVVYRARWSVRRARDRIDGAMQHQSVELSERDTGLRIGGTNTEVLAEIGQRVGLSFDQFCRSALLAQGEFARFLRADDRDRAELLERMTGTELYGELSIAAFERRKLALAEVQSLRERLADRKLLEDDARAALATERDTLNATHTRLEQEARRAEKAAIWYRDLERLQQEIVGSERDLAQAHADAVTVAQAAESQRAAFAAELDRHRESLSEKREECLRSLTLSRRWLADNEHLAPLSEQWERWSSTLLRYRASAGETQAIQENRSGLESSLTQRRADYARALEARKAAIAEFTVAERASQEAVDGEGAAVLGDRLRGVDQELERIRAAAAKHGAIGSAQQQEKQVSQKAMREDAAAKAAAELVARGESEIKVVVARCEEAERALKQAERFMSLAQHRSELVSGDPCPLCGATEHPLTEHETAGIDEELRPRVAELRKLESETREWLAVAERDRRAHTDLAAEAMAEASAQRESARELRATLTEDVAEADQVAALQRELLAQREAILAAHRRIEELRQTVERCRKALLSAKDLVTDCDRRARQAQTELQSVDQSLRHQESERERIVAELDHVLDDGRMPAGESGWRAQLERDPNGFLAQCERSVLDYVKGTGLATELATREKALAELLDALRVLGETETDADASDRRFDAALRALGEADAAAALPLTDLTELVQREVRRVEVDRRKQASIADRIKTTAAVLAERQRRKLEHEKRNRPEVDAAQAGARFAAARTELDALRPRRDEVLYELRRDDEARAEVAQLTPQIEARQRSFQTWDELSDLIGSYDGRAFRVYAQSLTLDCLLASANHHLLELAPRYRLQRVPGYDLDLQVVDLDMGEEVRSVNSLSGGESFLLSLALALGLSSISAASTRVESLFIDEGFGGLDPQTLDTALATLDALQATGRQVGVISHVTGIAERIGAQVMVQPMGSGRSTVRVAEASG